MNSLAYLLLVGILAGFALYYGPVVPFLASLTTLFHIIGALAILIFALIILYIVVKTLVKKM
jgi:hypothetical protein